MLNEETFLNSINNRQKISNCLKSFVFFSKIKVNENRCRIGDFNGAKTRKTTRPIKRFK